MALTVVVMVGCQESPGSELARPADIRTVTGHDLPFVVLAPDDVDWVGPVFAGLGTGRVSNEQLSELTLSTLDTVDTWNGLARVDGFESAFVRSEGASEEFARAIAHLFEDAPSAGRAHARLVQDARATTGPIPTGATTAVEEHSIDVGEHAATAVTVTTSREGVGELRATVLLQRDNLLLEAQAFGSANADLAGLATQLVGRMNEHLDGVIAGNVTWKPIASQPPRGYTPPPGAPLPVDFTSITLNPEDVVGPSLEVHSESCVPTSEGALHTRSFTARTPRFVLGGYDVEWLQISTELYETPEAARLAIQPLTLGMTHDAFLSRIAGLDGGPLIQTSDLLGTSFHYRDVGDGGASYKARVTEDTTYSYFVARVGSVVVTVAALGHEAADDSSQILVPIGELAVRRAAEAAASGSLVIPASCTGEDTRTGSGPTI